MLQPAELQHIADTHREDVATLRAFFAGAGVPLCAAGSLAGVARQLQQNVAFRRDLSLHVRLMQHGRTAPLGHADLLRLLALSAGGMEFAPLATREDAEALLHFVLDVQAVDSQAVNTPADPLTATVASRYIPSPQPSASIVPIKQAVSQPGQRPSAATTGKPMRRRLGFALAAVVCLLAILLLGRRLRLRPSPAAAGQPTALVPVQPEPRHPAPLLPPVQQGSEVPFIRSQRRSAHLDLNPVQAASVAAAPAPLLFRKPADVPAVASPAPAPAPEFRTSPGPSVAAAASVAAKMASPAVGAVPADVLSQRLGARPLPSDSAMDLLVYSAKHPQLKRRVPLTAGSGPVLLAEANTPASLPTAQGTVRPTVLGVMAGNILYSPAPAYPTAAAQAHVQGEVRVQAEVDRDGNVAAARVISGPEPLRAAAINAVQQWRYRPFVSSGRPTAMSTTAVVDFELQ